MNKEPKLLEFGDVMMNDISYEDFIRQALNKFLEGGLKELIYWMVEDFGRKGKLPLSWECGPDYKNSYGKMWVKIVEDHLDMSSYRRQQNCCLYETFDLDNPHSFTVYANRKITVELKTLTYGLGYMTIQSILDDCQAYLNKTIKSFHGNEYIWK